MFLVPQMINIPFYSILRILVDLNKFKLRYHICIYNIPLLPETSHQLESYLAETFP